VTGAATIRSAWIIRQGEEVPRLVTCYSMEDILREVIEAEQRELQIVKRAGVAGRLEIRPRPTGDSLGADHSMVR
jgi:hypothetical protein